MLGLLLWQLRLDALQLANDQRVNAVAHGNQLAAQLDLILRMKADAGEVFLRTHAAQAPDRQRQNLLLGQLRGIYPALHSLAWFDRNGQVVADSAPGSDTQLLAQLTNEREAPYHYRYDYDERDNGLVYLLLRRSDGEGGWVLRFPVHTLRSWLPASAPHLPWLLEDKHSGQVFLRQPEQRPGMADSFAPDEETLSQPLHGSDWRLHALYDAQAARQGMQPEQAGKMLLFILCAVVALTILFILLRDHRQLKAAHASSRRSLENAIGALGVIDERVLVTQADGQLSYVNPRAEQMFGLASTDIGTLHILSLLPALGPWVRDPGYARFEPIEILQHGRKRLYTVNSHDPDSSSKLDGRVWVLRDVTEEQHALRVLQDTRRRYQDIFEGGGVALCVFDLSELSDFLRQRGLNDGEQLPGWLEGSPHHAIDLLRSILLTEANQLALDLFDSQTLEQLWQRLIGDASLTPGELAHELASALLDGKPNVQLETRIRTAKDGERYLWLSMQLPGYADALQAVTLSLQDATSRKRIELSLAERERFWSDVLRAVPDTLYVHDLTNDTLLFSNNRLGQGLGYSREELREIGERLWEKLMHPDDIEQYLRIRNVHKAINDQQAINSQVRLRHRNGDWHWFDVREHAFARDEQGRVTHLIGVAKDITTEILTQASMSDSERRYRLLAESISDLIISSDSELKLNYVSPSAEAFIGYNAEWIMNNGLLNTVTNPQQLADLYLLLVEIRKALGNAQQLAALQSSLSSKPFIVDCLRIDGRKITVEIRVTLIWDELGHFEGLLGIGRDISQQRRAERELRMAATVFEHSTAAILVTDPAGYIVQSNKTFERITGYSASEVLDRQPSELTAEPKPSGQTGFILNQLNKHGLWEGELWLRRKNGENYPAWVGITAEHDSDGDLVSYVCFFNDISERKASEQRIHRLAYYDALTQLPNRTLFQDRLHTALQRAERHDEWVVLMFLDLDRFKPINDSLGHAAGDRMLKDVAVRLAACVDDEDTVARMGGDEFTLLLSPRESREAALGKAIRVAEQILTRLSQPFVLQGREFFVTASIGIALSPQDGNEASQLMKNADTAMYHAKERGKNNFQFYQADMNATALQRLELESDLRHALEQDQFLLYYQPQLNSDGTRLAGVEALLRWQHPRRGLVAPGEFIPVLEELGLVVKVGDWVIAEACRQMRDWQDMRIDVPKVSVNISARQFVDGQLGKRISSILREYGVQPRRLELELTESILMRDVGETMQTLVGLKQLGLSVAVDDFGTGYSSLNYLKQFPIDVLKIDRSFVDGLPGGEQDAQIARAIIAMAHSLNLAVIAEGVERHDQFDFLREHGCDEVQGYLFGAPMPAGQLEALLEDKGLAKA
ncbi:EAL domain-containing protein [Pseudomonas sp. LRF_L74]|uniref:EAL domain-containing protein n=1 Tax=Pseudomonas sp. LRF_L74 TaxID=3369422 RepID=UPI003F646F32